MPETLYFRDFSQGVISNIPPTKLIESASPRAWNTAFTAAPGGTLQVGPRPGWLEFGATAETFPVTGHATFVHEAEGLTTTHQIVITANGKLYELKPGAPAVPIPIQPGDFLFDAIAGAQQGCTFVQAKNRLFGFTTGGTPFKVYRKTAETTLRVAAIGVRKPVLHPFTLSSVGPGVLSGVIDVRFAWYDSSTDTEGSPSEIFSYTATSNALTLFLPPYPAGSLADKVRVYIRKQTLQSRFFRSAALEVPITQELITLNFTDAELNRMTLTPAPTEQAYDPPPARLRAGCWHLGRLFVTDGRDLFYSQPGNPEQFDPASTELVSAGDGEMLMALASLSDDTLGCFKERSIWGMSGQLPATWRFSKLSDTGTISTRSLAHGDDTWAFWSERGPTVWKPGSEPRLLVHETLEPFVKAGQLRTSIRDRSMVAFDGVGRRFLFGLDWTTESPWSVAPWNTAFGVWESIAWDLGPLTSLSSGLSSGSNEPAIFLSGPESSLRELSSRLRRDGATEGSSGAFAEALSVAGSTVMLDREPSIAQRSPIVRHINPRTLEVRRAPAVVVGALLELEDVLPGDLLVFDGPVTEWDTVDTPLGRPEGDKRLLESYAELWASGDTPAFIGLLRDTEQLPIRVWQTVFRRTARHLPSEGPALMGTVQSHKRWVGCLAQWVRFRVVGYYPLTEWRLVQLGLSYARQSTRDRP
jgi:hypothetical protein